MLRERVPLRDVVAFTEWWAAKTELETPGKGTKKVTKSSWDRHKNGEHFQMVEKTVIVPLADEAAAYETVSDIAREMVKRYGGKLNDPKWVPDAREAREWAALEAKVADIDQRRRDEEGLKALLLGAGYSKPRVIDVTPIELPATAGEETGR